MRDALRAEWPAVRTRPKRPNPQLVPLAEQIRTMLFEKQFIGTMKVPRILRELRSLGYAGGLTALYDHLAALEEDRTRTRVTERFETAPGQPGQCDGRPTASRSSARCGGSSSSGCCWGTVGASSTCPAMTRPRVRSQRRSSAPSPTLAARKALLVDNAKVFILDARPDALAWNPHFLELCGHYWVAPRHCQVRRAQTKGKVERPFFFLEQHFVKGRTFRDFDHLQQELAPPQAEELDPAIHAATQQSPLAPFEEKGRI